jgi:hypothetical protein
MMQIAAVTDPVAIAVKRYPNSDASKCNSFKPTTGIALE